jgi:hypothetical protein
MMMPNSGRLCLLGISLGFERHSMSTRVRQLLSGPPLGRFAPVQPQQSDVCMQSLPIGRHDLDPAVVTAQLALLWPSVV